jgi:hypothetical protein
MALTVNITYRDRDGQMHRTFADVTFDSSLVAGGESLTPAMLGFGSTIRELRVSGDHDGYIVQYNYSTQTLTAYQVPALDGNARGASGLDEADTVDLDSITEVKVVAIGY